MINDEQHVALPRLYGAPAYARPPRPVAATAERPFDEDDLPLEAFRGPDDDLTAVATSDTVVGGNGASHAGDVGLGLEPRPFSLRGLSRFISGR